MRHSNIAIFSRDHNPSIWLTVLVCCFVVKSVIDGWLQFLLLITYLEYRHWDELPDSQRKECTHWNAQLQMKSRLCTNNFINTMGKRDRDRFECEEET